MEQEEEKKIQIYGSKKRRQSSSSSESNSSIPTELVSEILLKLPAESIARTRCVSKLWSTITTDPFFIKSFETRCRPKKSLLIFFRKSDKLVVFNFPQYDRNSNGESYSSYSSHQVDRYLIKYPKNLHFSSTESVQGLICFKTLTTPIIWNPSNRQFLTLPQPDKSWKKGITVLLGYDPIAGKHKVVCMPRERFCNECMVLTLGGSSLSWRRIKTNLYHRPFDGISNKGRSISGVLYYKAHLQVGDKEQVVIMSFDLRSETFKPIRLPLKTWRDLLIAYEGRLAFVHTDKMGESLKMCVLKDAKKEEWSGISLRTTWSFNDKSLEASFKLSSSVTDGGEFIYVPCTCLKSSGILYFDPKRGSFRKAVYEETADDEFRLGNGLGNLRFYALQAFPNHIDSLITW